MSNQEGGVERSAGRHSFAIWGMIFSIVVVGIVILALGFWQGSGDNTGDVSREVVPAAPNPTASGTSGAGTTVDVAPAGVNTPATGLAESPPAN